MDNLQICGFPTVFFITQGTAENKDRRSKGDNHSPLLEDSNLLPHADENADRQPSVVICQGGSFDSSKPPGNSPPPAREIKTDDLLDIRKRYEGEGFSREATDVLMASWRNSTKRSYENTIRQWKLYAAESEVDPISPPVTVAVNFLAKLFKKGASLSSICLARSALSCYLNLRDGKFGELDCVKRFIKGVYESRPSVISESKISTWDVNIVLNLLESWYPNEKLSLKNMTLKLTMLLALLSGQRLQTLHDLDINNMILTESKCPFFISTLLKHSKRGSHQKPIEFLAFTDNPSLCIVEAIKTYVNMTQKIRGRNNSSKLLITLQKPHNHASKDTISRWVKSVMCLAGIDLDVFTPHSTRSASTSSVFKTGLSVKTILSAAGWSQSNTFARFYNKEIKYNFGQTILREYDKSKQASTTDN